MKNLISIFLFLFVSFSAPVFASELKVEILKDCNGKSLDSVLRSHNFVLNDDNYFHHSPSNCAFWIKLTTKEKWSDDDYLLFGNNINNYENVYCLNEEQHLLKQVTIGTDQFFESNTYLPSVKLSKNYKTILVKIKSNSFFKESFRVRKLKKVNLVNSLYIVLYVSVISLLLVMFTYFTFLYFKSSRKVLFYYICYILSVVLATVFISNFGRYFLWEKLAFSNTYFEGVMVMMLAVFYCLFASKATYLESWSSYLVKINIGFIIVFPVLFFCSLIFQSTEMLIIITKILPPIGLILIIIMVVQNVLNKNNSARYFLFGFTFFFIGVILRILINEGILNHSLFIETVIFISIILEIVVFSYVVIAYLNEEIYKGKINEEKLTHSLTIIDDLKKKIDRLNNSFESSQNISIVIVDQSINDVLMTPLSKREIEVLNSIIKGGKYLEISEELHISINTLKTHVSRIYSKLEISNRVEAINKVTKLSNLKK